MQLKHQPVLLQEVLEGLRLKPGDQVLDGTLGSGGHAVAILEQIGPTGRYIGLDQDPEALERSRTRLASFPQASFHHGNFEDFEKVLESLNIASLNAVIVDIGMASDQLENPQRGFSFEREGPLDMRMNPAAELSASDLIRELSEEELIQIFRNYGQERWARRFARGIVENRKIKEITTTQELCRVLESALPKGLQVAKGKRPPWRRRHPATRVFQALRIAVNDELNVLKRSLPRFWRVLKPGGRLAVISFHSLEDRIVKHQFREWKTQGEGEWVYKKPVTAGDAEVNQNPRARSAKLRVIEKGPIGKKL